MKWTIEGVRERMLEIQNNRLAWPFVKKVADVANYMMKLFHPDQERELSHFEYLNLFFQKVVASVQGTPLASRLVGLQRLCEEVRCGLVEEDRAVLLSQKRTEENLIHLKTTTVDVVRNWYRYLNFFWDAKLCANVRRNETSLENAKILKGIFLGVERGEAIEEYGFPVSWLTTLLVYGLFLENGAKRFKVTKGVATKLFYTDLPKNWERFVKLPFDACLFEFPEKISWMGQVTEVANPRVYLFNHPKTERIMFCMAMPDSPYVGSLVLSGPYDLLNGYEESKHSDDPRTNHVALIIKTLIYSADKSARLHEVHPVIDSEKKPKTEKQQEKLDRAIKKSYSLLGKDILIHAEQILDQDQLTSMDTTWKILHRFVVRGHFHTFMTGPGREIPIVKWVEPYVKGPEFADFINKNYTIQ